MSVVVCQSTLLCFVLLLFVESMLVLLVGFCCCVFLVTCMQVRRQTRSRVILDPKSMFGSVKGPLRVPPGRGRRSDLTSSSGKTHEGIEGYIGDTLENSVNLLKSEV